MYFNIYVYSMHLIYFNKVIYLYKVDYLYKVIYFAQSILDDRDKNFLGLLKYIKFEVNQIKKYSFWPTYVDDND